MPRDGNADQGFERGEIVDPCLEPARDAIVCGFEGAASFGAKKSARHLEAVQTEASPGPAFEVDGELCLLSHEARNLGAEPLGREIDRRLEEKAFPVLGERHLRFGPGAHEFRGIEHEPGREFLERTPRREGEGQRTGIRSTGNRAQELRIDLCLRAQRETRRGEIEAALEPGFASRPVEARDREVQRGLPSRIVARKRTFGAKPRGRSQDRPTEHDLVQMQAIDDRRRHQGSRFGKAPRHARLLLFGRSCRQPREFDPGGAEILDL